MQPVDSWTRFQLELVYELVPRLFMKTAYWPISISCRGPTDLNQVETTGNHRGRLPVFLPSYANNCLPAEIKLVFYHGRIFPKMSNYFFNITCNLRCPGSLKTQSQQNDPWAAGCQFNFTKDSSFKACIMEATCWGWVLFCKSVWSPHAQSERLPGYSNGRDGLIVSFFQCSFVCWLQKIKLKNKLTTVFWNALRYLNQSWSLLSYSTVRGIISFLYLLMHF